MTDGITTDRQAVPWTNDKGLQLITNPITTYTDAVQGAGLHRFTLATDTISTARKAILRTIH
jgi:hypothetical protein